MKWSLQTLTKSLGMKQDHLFESWPAKSFDVPYVELAFRPSVLLLSMAVENNFDPFLCLIDLSTHKWHKVSHGARTSKYIKLFFFIALFDRKTRAGIQERFPFGQKFRKFRFGAK